MTEERLQQLRELVRDFPGREPWQYHDLMRRRHGWRGFSTTVADGLVVLRKRGDLIGYPDPGGGRYLYKIA